MNGFFVWLKNTLTPKDKEPEYHPDILEAAEFDECDPEDIIWCSDCEAYHKGYY
jgi:hypothetical protein